MKMMDAAVRKRLIGVMRIIVWVTLSVDLFFFVFYLITDTMVRPVPAYVLEKLILPFAVNMAVYQFARKD